MTAITLFAASGENVNDTIEAGIKMVADLGRGVTISHNGREVKIGRHTTHDLAYAEWQRLGEQQQQPTSLGGVWVCDGDDGRITIWSAEIDALRVAVGHPSGNVYWWPFGETLQGLRDAN